MELEEIAAVAPGGDSRRPAPGGRAADQRDRRRELSGRGRSFLADLARRLTVPRRVDVIAGSSYGSGGESRGAVRRITDLRFDVAGSHLLAVEDIVDTGHNTLDDLVRILRAPDPASHRTCVLVRKPECLEVGVPIDYLGFDVPDRWVVGYGQEWADRCRALPCVGILDRRGAWS